MRLGAALQCSLAYQVAYLVVLLARKFSVHVNELLLSRLLLGQQL